MDHPSLQLQSKGPLDLGLGKTFLWSDTQRTLYLRMNHSHLSNTAIFLEVKTMNIIGFGCGFILGMATYGTPIDFSFHQFIAVFMSETQANAEPALYRFSVPP
jgi:hypothetical protein